MTEFNQPVDIPNAVSVPTNPIKLFFHILCALCKVHLNVMPAEHPALGNYTDGQS